MDDFVNLLDTDPCDCRSLWQRRRPGAGDQPAAPLPIKQVPAFARTLNRLGLAAAPDKRAPRCRKRQVAWELRR